MSHRFGPESVYGRVVVSVSRNAETIYEGPAHAATLAPGLYDATDEAGNAWALTVHRADDLNDPTPTHAYPMSGGAAIIAAAGDEPDTAGRLIDGDALVKALNDLGIPAYVEQTGGGCATLYCGPQVPSREYLGEREYGVAAGPGSFYGPAWTWPVFTLDDFYIGTQDREGSEDEGETVPADWSMEQIMERLVVLVEKVTERNRPVLIRVPDAEGDLAYDLLIPVPWDLDPGDVLATVERIVAEVKAAQPETYTFDDLCMALGEAGLNLPSPRILTTQVEW